MVLAVVNGGLGLKLASNSTDGKLAYIVVAAVMGAIYITATVLKRKSPGPGLARGGSKERIATREM
jgi:hypothetical protein